MCYTTLRNLAANDGRIAISVYDAKTLEGYQIRGTAEHVTEGAVVTTFKAMVEQMFQGAGRAMRFAPVSAHLHSGRNCGML
jgi:hypothetical protein